MHGQTTAQREENMIRAKLIQLVVVASSVFLALVADAYAVKPQPITQCDDSGMPFFNITRPGIYTLENDIVAISLYCIDINGIDRVKLKLNGYKISNAPNDGAAINIRNSNKIQILGPGTLEDNHFGVGFLGSSSGVTIRELLIYKSSSVGIHVANIIGISSDILIEGNIVAGGNNHGIFIDTNSNNVQIINNEVLNNNGTGILLNPGSDRVIRGNNSISNSAMNIKVSANNLDVEVTDNIALLAFPDFDIFVGQNSTGIIENNICETSVTGSLVVDCPPDLLPSFKIDHF